MTLVIVLFAVGIVLLGLEVVVPGGILGIAGGVLMLAGVAVAFARFGFQGGAIATGLALVLAAATLYFEFVLLPRSGLARTFSMTGTVAGRSQPPVAERALIGRTATAVTPLVPSGVVECDGRRYEAFARSGHVQPGEKLDIIDVDSFRLVVSKPSTFEKS